MDIAHDIKLRLPIEQLVGEYCQIHKKGRQLKCVCPFHNDTNPSMLISPDKGIAYCFACNSGGDIFSFYQKIEGVDFVTAMNALAEKVGIEVPKDAVKATVSKDEKERIFDVLQTAAEYYKSEYNRSDIATAYIQKRQLPADIVQLFGIGYAPNSYSQTYEYLLKKGFSQTDIVHAGLASVRDMDSKAYDRFRHRVQFPILNTQGRTVGFGGRTLGDDDAKYINSPETQVYNKSTVLYGYFLAKDEIRRTRTVVMVEGYFDCIAVHMCGVKNVVAVSGTALTQQHVQLLKRTADTVVLCLDQDAAGRAAAERAFTLCASEGLAVHIATIQGKDPDEARIANPDALKTAITESSIPYLEFVLRTFAASDTGTVDGKKHFLQSILPLIRTVPTAVEQELYIEKVATLLSVSVSSVQADMHRIAAPSRAMQPVAPTPKEASLFDRIDIALGLFLLYPEYLHLLPMIQSTLLTDFQSALYTRLQTITVPVLDILQSLQLGPEHTQRAAILYVYCEDLYGNDTSELLREITIKKQCQLANQYQLKQKNLITIRQLRDAQKNADNQAVIDLTAQMKSELEQLGKMSRP